MKIRTIILKIEHRKKMTIFKVLLIYLIPAFLLFCSFDASYAKANIEYPNRPIRLLIPFAVGAGGDLIARLITPKMAESLGQPFVIDNRSGASGIIGTDIVAKAAPDGYTIILASFSHASRSAFFPKLPYDPVKDFAAVGGVASFPYLLLVNSSLPAQNIKELIALARAYPEKLSYASPGIATPPHICTELFKLGAKIDLLHVPYKGSSEGLTAVISNEIQLIFVNPLSSIQQVRSGRLRALAVSTAKRLAILPEVPTVAESGLPNFEFSYWSGILAPAKTPPHIISKLNTVLVNVLANPDIQDKFVMDGSLATPSNPNQFAHLISTEFYRLTHLAKMIQTHPTNQ